MSETIIDRVVVVGGGTAGWLAAANLAKQFNSKAANARQVVLVESPDVPTIGVGEGTWPTMRKTLAKLGIKEQDFLVKCNATFKQATKFVNWRHAAREGVDNHYYHLFTSIFDPADFNLAPYWQQDMLATQQSYAECVSAQGRLCELGLAPKTVLNKEFEGVQNYAYHLDAGLFTKLLQQHATEQLGVQHILANVQQVRLADNGDIAAISTDSAGEVSGDFFVDCTGFNSLLLGQALQVPFHSIKDTLLTDHAVTIQVPYPDAQADIASCTISTAQDAGWIWDIGLSNRRGTGYVYSSEFVDHQQAEQTLRDYIGPAAESLEARRIKMNLGYREKFWHKNCVAIGLSAGFVEPLEASAIFLIEAAANMVSELLPTSRELLPLVAQKFNDSFRFRWQKTIDFIKMHYFLSQRQQPFWQANKVLSTVPHSLQMTLQRWREQPVSNYDFDHVYEPFPLESYQYVLYGMGFEQDLSRQRVAFTAQQQANAYQQQVQQIAAQLQQHLPKNRELINKIKQFGIQSI